MKTERAAPTSCQSPSTFSVTLFATFNPLPASFQYCLAGHLHGVGDRADSLGAVRVGAGSGAGPIYGAGAGQGGRPGACQPGHTGRGH